MHYLLLITTLAASQAQQKPLCFRGGPAAECRWFLITEARYQIRVNTGAGDERADPYGTGLPHYVTGETGLMRNVSPTLALGATVSAGYTFDSEALRLALFGRLRHWFGDRTSVEGSVGVAYSSKGMGILDGLGPAARVDWNVHDLLSLGLRAEWVPEGRSCQPQFVTEYGGCIETIWTSPMTAIGVDRSEAVRVWRLYAGVGLGSKPGVASWLAAGVLGLLAIGMHDCCGIN